MKLKETVWTEDNVIDETSGTTESRLEQIRCGSPTNTYGSTSTHLLPEGAARPSHRRVTGNHYSG